MPKAILQSDLMQASVEDGVIKGVRLMEVNRTATFKGEDGRPRTIQITPELINGLIGIAGNRSIPSHFSHDHYASKSDSIHARLGSIKNIRKDDAGNMVCDLHVMDNQHGKDAMWLAKNDPGNAAMSAIFAYNPIIKDGKTFAHPLTFEAADLVAVGAACSALFSASEEDGVWRTIHGRKIFIKNGQSLDDALREGGVEKTNDDYNKDNIDVSDDVPEGHTLTQDGALWIVKKDGKMVSAAASRSAAIDQAKNPDKYKSKPKKIRKTAHDKAMEKLQSIAMPKAKLSQISALLSAFYKEKSMTKEEIESLFDERIDLAITAALAKFNPKSPEGLLTKEQVGEQITAALSAHKPVISEEEKKSIAQLAQAELTGKIGQIGALALHQKAGDDFETAITAQLSAGAKDRTTAMLRIANDKPEIYNAAVKAGKA